MARIRAEFNRVDPLSAVLLVFFAMGFLPIALVPHLWPGTAVGHWIKVLMDTNILVIVWVVAVMAAGPHLPFERKRKEWAPYFRAIRQYDKAVRVFQEYPRERSADILTQCQRLMGDVLPWLSGVPEVASFAKMLRETLDRDFPMEAPTEGFGVEG